jgi:hypothetical protein
LQSSSTSKVICHTCKKVTLARAIPSDYRKKGGEEEKVSSVVSS